jgi:hypothetical protein
MAKRVCPYIVGGIRSVTNYSRNVQREIASTLLIQYRPIRHILPQYCTLAVGIMASAQYLVEWHGADWRIIYRGKVTSGYPTEQAAIDTAIHSAREAAATNPSGAMVLVRVNGGVFRTEWSSFKERRPGPRHIGMAGSKAAKAD